MGTQQLKTKLQNSLNEVRRRRQEVFYCIAVDDGSYNLVKVVKALDNFEKMFSNFLFCLNKIDSNYVYRVLLNTIKQYEEYMRINTYEANYWRDFNVEMLCTARRLIKDYA